MTEDRWITPQEARTALLEIPGVERIEKRDTNTNGGKFLHGINEYGCTLFAVRIFSGAEHELARHGMVLDWRT